MKTYWKVVLLALLILGFFFVVPPLISAKHDIPLTLGLVLLVAWPAAVFLAWKRLFPTKKTKTSSRRKRK